MKRGIIGAIVGAATVAAVLAIGPARMATATPVQETEACYEQVLYTVYQFSKTIPAVEEVSHLEYSYSKEVKTPTYGDVIEKETQTRTWIKGEAGFWQNFEPNKDQGTFDGPPSWPSDPRGTWSKARENGGPQQNTSGVFQNGSGNGSWFYRDLGTEGSWSDWGPWTDWPGAGPVNDDGRNRGPAPHGSGPGWERQYRYVVVGQFQNGTTTETVFSGVVKEPLGEPWVLLDGYPKKVIDTPAVPASTVFYNDGNVGPTDLAVDGQRNPGWTTDQTLDRSWKQIRTDRFMKDGKQIPCSDEAIPVAPTVVAPTCFAAGRVVLPESTPGYEWMLQEDGTYLAVADEGYYFDEDADTTFDPGDLSQLTGKQCQTQPPQPPRPPVTPQGVLPVVPTVTLPTCEAAGSVVLPTVTVGYDWVLQPNGTTWKAVIEPGFVFDPFAVTTFEFSGDLSQKTGDDCDDVESKPPIVTPPTVAPPAVAPPAQTPTAGATQLPSTGNSSWALALIALVTLLGGAGLVRLSRRPTD